MTEPAFDPAAQGWTPHSTDGFQALIGPLWSKQIEGVWRWGFVADARHLNGQGVVHGGMLMTMIDQALGITVYFAAGKKPAVTIDLSVKFVDAARLGDFIEAHTTVVRTTRSLVFMSGQLTRGARPVLTAQGIWKILGA